MDYRNGYTRRADSTWQAASTVRPISERKTEKTEVPQTEKTAETKTAQAAKGKKTEAPGDYSPID